DVWRGLILSTCCGRSVLKYDVTFGSYTHSTQPTKTFQTGSEAKGDVLCHGEMWEEGIVLGHVAYTPLLRWQMATLGAVVERLAIEEDAPRVWLHNASNSLFAPR